MATAVRHFGIHTGSGGVKYLVQQPTPRSGRERPDCTATNALGMKLPAKYEVQNRNRVRCNHDIRINEGAPSDAHWETFMDLAREDELVRAMLPVVHTPPLRLFVREWPQAHETMNLLAQMTSPTDPIVITLWACPIPEIMRQMEGTNVQPLVITDVDMIDTRQIDQLGKVHIGLPRSLIVVGDKDFIPNRDFKVIKTTLGDRKLDDLIQLPWSRIGGAVCRKFMRGDWSL